MEELLTVKPKKKITERRNSVKKENNVFQGIVIFCSCIFFGFLKIENSYHFEIEPKRSTSRLSNDFDLDDLLRIPEKKKSDLDSLLKIK